MSESVLSVADAAARLGVSTRRVRQYIGEGDLAAQKLGTNWMVSAESVRRMSSARRRAGQPFSAEMARAMVDLLGQHFGGPAGPEWESLSASQRSRLRARLKRLLSSQQPAMMLRSWLPARAARSCWDHSGELTAVVGDQRVREGGAACPELRLSRGRTVDLHVAAGDANAFVAAHWLTPDPVGALVLHVEPVVRTDVAACLVDLAQHGGPREDHRVAELLR